MKSMEVSDETHNAATISNSERQSKSSRFYPLVS